TSCEMTTNDAGPTKAGIPTNAAARITAANQVAARGRPGRTPMRHTTRASHYSRGDKNAATNLSVATTATCTIQGIVAVTTGKAGLGANATKSMGVAIGTVAKPGMAAIAESTAMAVKTNALAGTAAADPMAMAQAPARAARQ